MVTVIAMASGPTTRRGVRRHAATVEASASEVVTVRCDLKNTASFVRTPARLARSRKRLAWPDERLVQGSVAMGKKTRLGLVSGLACAAVLTMGASTAGAATTQENFA